MHTVRTVPGCHQLTYFNVVTLSDQRIPIIRLHLNAIDGSWGKNVEIGGQVMDSRMIRKTFTEYFVERGHIAVPSSSLIPTDPTVLLTTAGMQQMTPYFLGLESPPGPRLTSIQKSFRAVGKADDVLEVGDSTHLTFFEMLGNFSVGDYFKETAIELAWDLLHKTYGIPKDAFWITVNPDDDTSRSYWRDNIGIPAHKIQDDPTNVWGPVGDTGPCGPNSELYVDLEYGQKGDTGRGPVSEDEDRYVEVWNLVFMEFYQQADGSWEQLESQNVDTGMGLERLAMVLQETETIYETDLFLPIIKSAAEIAGVTYGLDLRTDNALRIIADHARGIAFLIADGVTPANEDRGYVLRRILRRSIQKGHSLGITEPFLARLTDITVAEFGDQYPELRQHQARIQSVVNREEAVFRQTIDAGITRLNVLLADLEASDVNMIPGGDAFRLHDTYGFPIDLTLELAGRSGFEVDIEGFRENIRNQREQSRGDLARFADLERERAPLYAAVGNDTSRFVGYDTDNSRSTIVAILGPDSAESHAAAGQEVELILDCTPFYGEAGGQIGDTGVVRTETGEFRVTDTRKPSPQITVHRGMVTEGDIQTGQSVEAQVDTERRKATQRNHTATHLLHRALRIVLGDETHQAGSLVTPERLRFDFTSVEPVSNAELERVSRIANLQVIEDLPVESRHDSYSNAVASGAMALFGEKYTEQVRVVSIDSFSSELCGGTHVSRTGEIGPIIILSESSIGSGVRRIESITGETALEHIQNLSRLASELSETLKSPESELISSVEQLQKELRERQATVDELKFKLAISGVDQLLGSVVDVNGIQVLASVVEAPDRDTLLRIGDRLRDAMQSGVIVLGTVIDDKPALLAMVTSDQAANGLQAGKIIQEVAPIVGGRGGGRPEVAQGGGSDAAKLNEAIDSVVALIERMADS